MPRTRSTCHPGPPFEDVFGKALALALQTQMLRDHRTIDVVKSVEGSARTRNLSVNVGLVAFINIYMSLLYSIEHKLFHEPTVA
ncbi:hypothetical protein RX330_10615 [Bradyrhizobium sp. NDS-1]|uniref:hypothetical protein n=1 Tax=Bradyrhizobium sp. NDS-1 TaxID=3080014 RepID=UPI00293F4134|nr:hypothetical protein [Bradyrhizobium sp. NDS-1]WOH75517.1 hypothetical protein RX330_10615 [Bradyrhizobium sp. NDS-1]